MNIEKYEEEEIEESEEPSEKIGIESKYLKKSDQNSNTVPSKMRCSRVLYNEFLNCDSYLYNVPEKEDSEAISSDGEFNDFKYFNMVDQNSSLFYKDEYDKLVREKYANDPETMIRFLEAKNQFNIDYDLRKLAIENLEKKANENEYMNKRLVTKNGGVAIPRWASDLELVKHIGKTQQKDINPDAIFGQIDPRDSNNVKLNEMFKD